MKKKLILASVILSVIVIPFGIMYRLSRKAPLEIKYNCVEYTLGDDKYREIEIILAGRIKNQISKEVTDSIKFDSFMEILNVLRGGITEQVIEYAITIDGETYPQNEAGEVVCSYNTGPVMDMNGNVLLENTGYMINKLYYDNSFMYTNISYIRYNTIDSRKVHYEDIGRLFFSDDMSEIFLIRSIPDESGSHWSTEDGNIVIMSSNNIEEAEVLAMKLSGMDLRR